MVKLDMLGVEPYVEGRISEAIECARYDLEADDFEVAMEALSYCILHIAKMNAIAPEPFSIIWESMLIKQDFYEPFYSTIKGSIADMREILMQENERG